MTKSAKIIIVISLLLNLMLAGVIIGHACHLMGDDIMNHSTNKQLPPLSSERQEELKTTMDKVKHDSEIIHQEIIQTREHTIEILTAEHFDENAYEDQIDHITELKTANQHRLGDAIKKLAIHWSPTERQQLAEILRHPLLDNKACPPPHDGTGKQ